ncbi:MAG TPA: multifunctional oxoglutarate decarboxylase/oxoglutarate dehydrogenase thiamine pyrophosphate-binding subunit/dihydrolipoyllysine-residue succinyltransferase subunit [Terriglobales bacterium]|nr:multifunctional oxoglutarate decarboxylase/oxoglutarate dehydrogenase thiamine pyrophosphate-binding subunit/dihydrolipoyllysine-residue succinyltransferase subunit [Terriglobales bacterium]
MTEKSYLETLGANEGYGEELWRLYQANANAVPEAWRAVFDRLAASARPGASSNGHHAAEPAAASPAIPLLPGDQAEPLRGGAARLAANMAASLSVPTATSQRTFPVARMEANRQLLNQWFSGQASAKYPKLSMTPLLAWAIVRAAVEFPSLNSAYTEINGAPSRIARAHVNIGLAVDVERASGRTLLVPVVKQAETMHFGQFFLACDGLIKAARGGKIAPDDLQGATLSLTNPGTIGTRASVPRLMAGQAAIIAAGAVAYPAGFEAVPEATLRALGIGKSCTLSCTYDHRLVQGAESGAFLARVEALLGGSDEFYQRIFSDLGAGIAPVDRLPTPAIAAPSPADSLDEEMVAKQAAVFQLVHAFRVRGHLQANVDPLRMRAPEAHPELDPAHFHLGSADLSTEFLCPLAGRDGQSCRLDDILRVLRSSYCGTLALEFMHLQRPEERVWLQQRLEVDPQPRPDADLRRQVLLKLTQAEEFEHLLHARFVGHKRFSLEGAEALIPALDRLLSLAVDGGTEEVVLGMSHRGRLNILVTTLGLSMAEMFSKFEDMDPNSVDGSGDVKYHLGASGEHVAPSGRRLAIEMISNPSHLEAVDPVVEGATRARQDIRHDERRSLVLPLLIHGDAAFAGQGVVAETLNLSQLGGYRTGGTVHLIVNNQIGFTTSPSGARSSLYCTDVARTVQAPIFHVNGDDAEAMVRAVELALAFRNQFRKDVVVDMVCYRRHGHNEADDPSLTAPVLYRKIEAHPSVRKLYAAALVSDGLLADESAATAAAQAVKDELSRQAAAPLPESQAAPAPAAAAVVDTAVPAERLTSVGERLLALPEGFHLHPKLRTFFDRRRQAIASQAKLDWSLAESLALGTLALEGTPVRVSGQDSGRGTFSQRHAVVYDYENAAPYIPLAHLSDSQAPFEIYDSLLSEEAALGFEFGYSMTHPDALVIWEAQFGDFVNGAQAIIDQFVAASEAKWARTSGVTLLLPHGFEGQGPEHSSARIERFLELSADDNWRVANCTTAAQYFHLLRSQGRQRPHRPLIVFTPKSLLRHPEVASPFASFTSGWFQAVLTEADEPDAADRSEAVRRVLICSGKIYYDLKQARKAQPQTVPTALVRCEQLYPFPAAEIAEACQRFPNLEQIRWVQEEPENMGAWTFVAPRLAGLAGTGVHFAGIYRAASPSPATGSLRRHQQEQASIVAAAFAD